MPQMHLVPNNALVELALIPTLASSNTAALQLIACIITSQRQIAVGILAGLDCLYRISGHRDLVGALKTSDARVVHDEDNLVPLHRELPAEHKLSSARLHQVIKSHRSCKLSLSS